MPPQAIAYEMLEEPAEKKARELSMLSFLDPEPPRSEPSVLQSLMELKDLVINWLNHVRSRVEFHSDAIDESETRRRRDVLLFHGIKEREGENLERLLSHILRTILELTEFNVYSFKDCHRIGSAQTNNGRPRPVLARFDTVALKALVWAKKRAFKGSDIIVTEFLTKARQTIFMEARRLYGLRRCWTKDGVIFVIAPDDTKHQMVSQSEFENFKQMYPPNGERPSPTPSTSTYRDDDATESTRVGTNDNDAVAVVTDATEAAASFA